MTNPLPPDNRAYGSLFRTSEVMKIPIQYLRPYPGDHRNPHDVLTEDILCSICETRGNVKNVDPSNLGDDTINNAPEVGRSYLWDYPTLQRNHRCSLCRLVWRTFQQFYEIVDETRLPVAVLGRHSSHGHENSRSIELIAMVFKNTLDNQDIRGSGQVYIYEDERIPHFNITQRATGEDPNNGKAAHTEWRQSKILKNDQIDFDVVKSWLTVCKAEHGSKCNGHEKHKPPARRLIDVEKGCIVNGSTVTEYLTLSYVWGMAAQFMLTKDVVKDSSKEGFFGSLGTKVPQSIRDAMQVCRNIGVRHLWVDALCIVQDDEQDKDDQIRLMDEIYGQALAVLIVAAGDDANYGIPGMGEKKRALATYEETVDGKVLMTSLATTTFSAKRSHWNTRAWTYQEYILGKRLLVFTDTYVFFKCAESMFLDDAVLPTLGPLPPMPIQSDGEWISFTLNDSSEDKDPKKVWKDYYKVLSRTLGPFHFGLPREYFGRSLLWTDPHHGIFKRRVDFQSSSWAGWKWAFEYFNAEQSTVGASGYKMPEETVPIQFLLFNDGNERVSRLIPILTRQINIKNSTSRT
ncbi:heterokaryon incompatibility protein-domain-containing protein [Lophiotrema nucula]|uniref:Heterokaryon incompatibility protein-domain-containing protein n=1 Tax=Lophiotrema nucula TaxID=690887 RepID=A0A6A5YN67_9PLEO|nr:heterokaryon incompatibility protein-domain-containing protein [Lophiotrema nucula]